MRRAGQSWSGLGGGGPMLLTAAGTLHPQSGWRVNRGGNRGIGSWDRGGLPAKSHESEIVTGRSFASLFGGAIVGPGAVFVGTGGRFPMIRLAARVTGEHPAGLPSGGA